MSTPQIERARMVQARFTLAAVLRNRWVLVAIAVLVLVVIVAASWN